MRTVFIVAPYFPPSAMPPAQRTRLLVRHLEDYGWHPVVFTVRPDRLVEGTDPWMLEIAGNRYERVETGCLDARKTRKLGIGDLGLRAFIFFFFSLLKQARRRKPALILYPVPPWYTMVMAPFIKWMTGVPFAIDFIDPWIYKVDPRNRKAVLNQRIARRLEGFVVRRSSAILAVSQGILDDVAARHPSVASQPLVAVPYGVEASDFRSISVNKAANGPLVIRYTGAISEAMLPVTADLLQALKLVNERQPIRVVFTGTSYAPKDLARPVLQQQIEQYGLSAIVTENPFRVGYREALELSLSADLQLLIGDTTPYYAASKLMGLAASGQPFFAFVHRESFPAKFLAELSYTNKTVFLPDELGSAAKVEELAAAIGQALATRQQFRRIDENHPVLTQYTADAMTRTFSDTFKKIIHE
jgi:glycosyltransferase involved in cell wall biosynthesis